jgi:hypothetical protein
VGALVHLQRLELQDNGVLEAVPASCAALVRMRYFDMSNTAIAAIPYEVQFWTELTDLVACRNTQFDGLPGTASSMPTRPLLEDDEGGRSLCVHVCLSLLLLCLCVCVRVCVLC